MDYYQHHDSEPKSHELEDMYAQMDYDPERPRPMTSAEYQGEGRRQGNKYGGTQEYQGHQQQQQGRAFSAKPYKADKGQTVNVRKTNEKPQSTKHTDTKNQNFVFQNNKLVANPSSDFARIRPKNIMQDKERLYEETLHLKNHVNALREENMKLKTKVNNLEKEAGKFEKMIQEANTAYYKDTPTSKTAENHLTLTLKQNVKDLKNVLKKREDELTDIKKVMKYTKIQELETQMKAFQDEAARLRTIMDHVMQEKAQIVMSDDDKNRLQEEYFIQATQLKTLQRDNEEMATAIKILEEQNFEYEKKITELEKKFRREQNAHKKSLQEREKELQKMKNEVGVGGATGVLGQPGGSKRPMTGINRDDALRQELEKKTLENNNLINQLAEKRNQTLNLERQLRDMKTEYNEKVTTIQNEKQALLRELEKLKNAKASGPNEPSKDQSPSNLKVQELKLDDYVKRASLQRAFSQEEKDNLMMYGPGSGKGAQNDKKQQQSGGPRKRVQKVRPEDVKNIGYELNLRLRIKKLTFEEIDRVIWPEKVRKNGTVSLKEMIDILKNDPFNMTNEDDLVLTARFLIEDNEHEYLYYDENVKNDLQIVRSILKKMIGNLPLWDEHRMKKMHEEIAEICVNNYGGLRENLKVLCKSGFIQAKDLKEACDLIEVPITDEQVEYVIMKLFEYSDNIHKLSIDRLFEIFTLKPKELTMQEESPRTQQSDSSPLVKKSPFDENEGHGHGHGHGSHAIHEEGEEEGDEEDEGYEGHGHHHGDQKGYRISEKPGEEEDDYEDEGHEHESP